MIKNKKERVGNTTSTKKASIGRSSFDDTKKRKSKRRFKKYMLHYILIILFMLSSIVVLSQTVLFKIENIIVVGNDRYKDTEIIDNSFINKEDNLFRIDKQKAKENIIKKFSYIKDIDIIRKFPDTVQINTTMCKPFATLSTKKGYTVISQNSKILEVNAKEILPKTMLVVGLEEKIYKVGEDYSNDKSSEIYKLMNFISQLEKSNVNKIVFVDFSDVHNFKALYDDRILIEFGEQTDLTYKINKIPIIMAKDDFDFKGEFEGTIDLSIEGQTRVRPANIKELLKNDKEKTKVEDDKQNQKSKEKNNLSINDKQEKDNKKS